MSEMNEFIEKKLKNHEMEWWLKLQIDADGSHECLEEFKQRTSTETEQQFESQLNEALVIRLTAIERIYESQVTSNKYDDIEYVEKKYQDFVESRYDFSDETYKFIIGKYYTLINQEKNSEIKACLINELKNMIKKHQGSMSYNKFYMAVRSYVYGETFDSPY
jgi:hypothetical protein